MHWYILRFDSTVNIDGIISAVAILGAAVGFFINLAKTWHKELKEKKLRGTNFIILGLLESNFQNGLSEEDLWRLYSGSETLLNRQYFSAFSPKKLNRVGFNRQLKQLQCDFLIRLTGPAHYHIDFQDNVRWVNYIKKNRFVQVVDRIKIEVGELELYEILSKSLKSDGRNFYRLKDTYRFLMEKGDDSVVTNIIADLKSSDVQKRNAAIELFIELTNEIKY